MKKLPLVKFRGQLDRNAARILRDVPDVGVEAVGLKGRQSLVLHAGDVVYPVAVKAQRKVNVAAARQLVEHAERLPEGTRLIVVARATTQDARDVLDVGGVGLIDAAGNMRVRLPGIFIWREDRRVAHRDDAGDGAKPPVRLTGKAGVVAEALLVEPEREWSVRDLSERAGVSAGLAHRVLVRLEREKLVEAKGSGPRRTRRVVDATALLDLWAEELRDRLVAQARGFRLARDPRDQASALSRLLAQAGIDHAVTGAAGAALLAPFVTAVPVVDIWVTETSDLDDVLREVNADRVEQGHNLVLRQAVDDGPLAFRRRVQEVWLASPFRLFYDLRHDPRRGREQADRLREEVIGF